MSWLKWLVKTAASAIVISLITLFTTWYMVSLIATNLFEQLHLPANLIPRVQFSDVIGAVFGGTKNQVDNRITSNGAGTGIGASAKTGINRQADSGTNLDSERESETDSARDTARDFTSDSERDSTTDSARDSARGTARDSTTDSARDSARDSEPGLESDPDSDANANVDRAKDPYENADEDADEDLSTGTGGSSSGENPDPDIWGDAKEVWKQERKVIISAEDVSRIRDEMSDEDKLRVFSLLAYKLPEAEVQVISTMIERGITEEEALEIQDRLKLYLTDQEYEELLTLLTG